MTADAAVALSSVRRETLIWFSPLPCSCWHHTGPASPGHPPSLSGLLPAFFENTKRSAISFYAD
jgi:hypothetical protein